jgi:hypothetical protein
MRLSKFLSLAFLLTLFSSLYVWQQTEVFRLAYEGQKNTTSFKELLDENSFLRYNLKKNTSLVRLGTKAWQSGDFCMPANFCLVKVAEPRTYSRIVSNSAPRRQSLAARIFGFNRQAEAKTISPSISFKVDGD